MPTIDTTLVPSDWELQFDKLFQQLPVGVVLCQTDGTPLRVNQATEELAGYSEEELLEMPCEEITHLEDVEKYMEQAQKLINKELDYFSIKKRYIRKDGQILSTKVFATRVDQQAEKSQILVVVENAAPKGSRRAKSQNTELWPLLLNNMQDHLSILDANGNYLWVGPSSNRFNGYSPEELLGKDPLRLVHKKDQKSFKRGLFQHVLSGKQVDTFKQECRFLQKEGSYMWVETIFKPIYLNNGQLDKILTSSRNINKRKQAELQLKKLTIKLMEQNEKLRQYAFHTSHNLRAPVVNLLGLVELLEENPKHPNHNAEIIQNIKEASKGLDDAILNLNKLVHENDIYREDFYNGN